MKRRGRGKCDEIYHERDRGNDDKIYREHVSSLKSNNFFFQECCFIVSQEIQERKKLFPIATWRAASKVVMWVVEKAG